MRHKSRHKLSVLLSITVITILLILTTTSIASTSQYNLPEPTEVIYQFNNSTLHYTQLPNCHETDSSITRITPESLFDSLVSLPENPNNSQTTTTINPETLNKINTILDSKDENRFKSETFECNLDLHPTVQEWFGMTSIRGLRRSDLTHSSTISPCSDILDILLQQITHHNNLHFDQTFSLFKSNEPKASLSLPSCESGQECQTSVYLSIGDEFSPTNTNFHTTLCTNEDKLAFVVQHSIILSPINRDDKRKKYNAQTPLATQHDYVNLDDYDNETNANKYECPDPAYTDNINNDSNNTNLPCDGFDQTSTHVPFSLVSIFLLTDQSTLTRVNIILPIHSFTMHISSLYKYGSVKSHSRHVRDYDTITNNAKLAKYTIPTNSLHFPIVFPPWRDVTMRPIPNNFLKASLSLLHTGMLKYQQSIPTTYFLCVADIDTNVYTSHNPPTYTPKHINDSQTLTCVPSHQRHDPTMSQFVIPIKNVPRFSDLSSHVTSIFGIVTIPQFASSTRGENLNHNSTTTTNTSTNTTTSSSPNGSNETSSHNQDVSTKFIRTAVPIFILPNDSLAFSAEENKDIFIDDKNDDDGRLRHNQLIYPTDHTTKFTMSYFTNVTQHISINMHVYHKILRNEPQKSRYLANGAWQPLSPKANTIYPFNLQSQLETYPLWALKSNLLNHIPPTEPIEASWDHSKHILKSLGTLKALSILSVDHPFTCRYYVLLHNNIFWFKSETPTVQYHVPQSSLDPDIETCLHLWHRLHNQPRKILPCTTQYCDGEELMTTQETFQTEPTTVSNDLKTTPRLITAKQSEKDQQHKDVVHDGDGEFVYAVILNDDEFDSDEHVSIVSKFDTQPTENHHDVHGNNVNNKANHYTQGDSSSNDENNTDEFRLKRFEPVLGDDTLLDFLSPNDLFEPCVVIFNPEFTRNDILTNLPSTYQKWTSQELKFMLQFFRSGSYFHGFQQSPYTPHHRMFQSMTNFDKTSQELLEKLNKGPEMMNTFLSFFYPQNNDISTLTLPELFNLGNNKKSNNNRTTSHKNQIKVTGLSVEEYFESRLNLIKIGPPNLSNPQWKATNDMIGLHRCIVKNQLNIDNCTLDIPVQMKKTTNLLFITRSTLFNSTLPIVTITDAALTLVFNQTHPDITRLLKVPPQNRINQNPASITLSPLTPQSSIVKLIREQECYCLSYCQTRECVHSCHQLSASAMVVVQFESTILGLYVPLLVASLDTPTTHTSGLPSRNMTKVPFGSFLPESLIDTMHKLIPAALDYGLNIMAVDWNKDDFETALEKLVPRNLQLFYHVESPSEFIASITYLTETALRDPLLFFFSLFFLLNLIILIQNALATNQVANANVIEFSFQSIKSFQARPILHTESPNYISDQSKYAIVAPDPEPSSIWDSIVQIFHLLFAPWRRMNNNTLSNQKSDKNGTAKYPNNIKEPPQQSLFKLLCERPLASLLFPRKNGNNNRSNQQSPNNNNNNHNHLQQQQQQQPDFPHLRYGVFGERLFVTRIFPKSTRGILLAHKYITTTPSPFQFSWNPIKHTIMRATGGFYDISPYGFKLSTSLAGFSASPTLNVLPLCSILQDNQSIYLLSPPVLCDLSELFNFSDDFCAGMMPRLSTSVSLSKNHIYNDKYQTITNALLKSLPVGFQQRPFSQAFNLMSTSLNKSTLSTNTAVNTTATASEFIRVQHSNHFDASSTSLAYLIDPVTISIFTNNGNNNTNTTTPTNNNNNNNNNTNINSNNNTGKTNPSNVAALRGLNQTTDQHNSKLLSSSLGDIVSLRFNSIIWDISTQYNDASTQTPIAIDFDDDGNKNDQNGPVRSNRRARGSRKDPSVQMIPTLPPIDTTVSYFFFSTLTWEPLSNITQSYGDESITSREPQSSSTRSNRTCCCRCSILSRIKYYIVLFYTIFISPIWMVLNTLVSFLSFLSSKLITPIQQWWSAHCTLTNLPGKQRRYKNPLQPIPQSAEPVAPDVTISITPHHLVRRILLIQTISDAENNDINHELTHTDDNNTVSSIDSALALSKQTTTNTTSSSSTSTQTPQTDSPHTSKFVYDSSKTSKNDHDVDDDPSEKSIISGDANKTSLPSESKSFVESRLIYAFSRQQVAAIATQLRLAQNTLNNNTSLCVLTNQQNPLLPQLVHRALTNINEKLSTYTIDAYRNKIINLQREATLKLVMYDLTKVLFENSNSSLHKPIPMLTPLLPNIPIEFLNSLPMLKLFQVYQTHINSKHHQQLQSKQSNKSELNSISHSHIPDFTPHSAQTTPQHTKPTLPSSITKKQLPSSLSAPSSQAPSNLSTLLIVLIHDVLSAVHHLHRNGIIHGNINLSNVLLNHEALGDSELSDAKLRALLSVSSTSRFSLKLDDSNLLNARKIHTSDNDSPKSTRYQDNANQFSELNETNNKDESDNNNYNNTDDNELYAELHNTSISNPFFHSMKYFLWNPPELRDQIIASTYEHVLLPGQIAHDDYTQTIFDMKYSRYPQGYPLQYPNTISAPQTTTINITQSLSTNTSEPDQKHDFVADAGSSTLITTPTSVSTTITPQITPSSTSSTTTKQNHLASPTPVTNTNNNTTIMQQFNLPPIHPLPQFNQLSYPHRDYLSTFSGDMYSTGVLIYYLASLGSIPFVSSCPIPYDHLPTWEPPSPQHHTPQEQHKLYLEFFPLYLSTLRHLHHTTTLDLTPLHPAITVPIPFTSNSPWSLQESILLKSLISSLLQPTPGHRLSAFTALHHPLFWTAKKQLQFVVLLSDFLDPAAIEQYSFDLTPLIFALERDSSRVLSNKIQSNWLTALSIRQLNLSLNRAYSTASVLDAMRFVRNFFHHAQPNISTNDSPDIASWLLEIVFPKLFFHCWIIFGMYGIPLLYNRLTTTKQSQDKPSTTYGSTIIPTPQSVDYSHLYDPSIVIPDSNHHVGNQPLSNNNVETLLTPTIVLQPPPPTSVTFVTSINSSLSSYYVGFSPHIIRLMASQSDYLSQ